MTISARLGMVLGCLLLALALAAPASAAKIPNGSYRQSCSNVKVRDASSNRAMLTADCRDARGRYRGTSLRYRQCRADIANIDGQLACWGGGGRPPGGSWAQSCRNGFMQGGTLHADCQRRDGAWWRASIRRNRCPRDRFANIDGQLRCE